jgi:exodeoxyribonuclease VIII
MQWEAQRVQAPTAAKMLGTAAHATILEPERVREVWMPAPDFGDLRTKAAREDRDAWRARNPSMICLSPDDAARVRGMAAAVAAHPAAREALSAASLREVPVAWGVGGVAVKGLFDAAGPGIVLDLKTCRDAGEGFQADAARRIYHAQLAHYRQGWARRCGVDPAKVRAVIIAVESEPPHDVVVWDLGEDALDVGARLVEEAIRRAEAARVAGAAAGYSSAPVRFKLPRWAGGSDGGLEGLGLE